ncbi:MAG: site-2 protease family protein, partial [Alphaproteobacteria bacterium]|nr:site-2 protease family protein [Alphaproteobacteria bacterium]
MSFELIEIILSFAVVISIIVFVHELGHYGVARWVGVQVEEFSIGFGREIYGRTDRHGTRWRIAILPLGGYVKMLGDADPAGAKSVGLEAIPESLRAKSLQAQKLWHRAAIVFAGPAFNLIFAAIMLAVIYCAIGQQQIVPVVGTIADNSAASKVDLKSGDRILAIDDQSIDRVEQ